jgi:hypothetical protein
MLIRLRVLHARGAPRRRRRRRRRKKKKVKEKGKKRVETTTMTTRKKKMKTEEEGGEKARGAKIPARMARVKRARAGRMRIKKTRAKKTRIWLPWWRWPCEQGALKKPERTPSSPIEISNRPCSIKQAGRIPSELAIGDIPCHPYRENSRN